MSDFLAAEKPILQRLKEEIPGAHVLPMGDLGGLQERGQVTPAIYLSIVTTTPKNTRTPHSGQLMRQVWAVTVVARSYRDVKGGSGAREQAGPLIHQVITTLSSWAPQVEGDTYTPLCMPENEPHQVDHSESGFIYYTLFFNTEFVI
ncbi:MAG: hypothetical protein HQL52_03900 [Magnetococcales bacterium]|nr:hypothetical protein [Magnetococcales bacterium]